MVEYRPLSALSILFVLLEPARFINYLFKVETLLQASTLLTHYRLNSMNPLNFLEIVLSPSLALMLKT